MSVVIEEYATANNYVESYEGKLMNTFVFDENDTLGIIGCVLSLISQKEDVKVEFSDY